MFFLPFSFALSCIAALYESIFKRTFGLNRSRGGCCDWCSAFLECSRDCGIVEATVGSPSLEVRNVPVATTAFTSLIVLGGFPSWFPARGAVLGWSLLEW